jgi:NADH pyrophosphatase NudC (nudix superfamily)
LVYKKEAVHEKDVINENNIQSVARSDIVIHDHYTVRLCGLCGKESKDQQNQSDSVCEEHAEAQGQGRKEESDMVIFEQESGESVF